MSSVSAGLLLYRFGDRGLELLLVHPGGPFWRNKDEGAWTIPKGELGAGEDALAAARREFHEETGFSASGPFIALGTVRLKSGKLIHAWACEGDVEPAELRSNTFIVEWPPRSGRRAEFPEIDRAQFFTPDEARKKLNLAQVPLVDELVKKLAGG
jgi:predicted NUDIX family NTP pyrophosphohydrolase